jgi:IS5 family transposase
LPPLDLRPPLVTKRTRKREFLDEMNLVIPWSELLSLIARAHPEFCVRGIA